MNRRRRGRSRDRDGLGAAAALTCSEGGSASERGSPDDRDCFGRGDRRPLPTPHTVESDRLPAVAAGGGRD